MPTAIRIPLDPEKVIALRHRRCTFTAEDVQADARDNWPRNVDMVWVLEHGAAQTKDRVWLALAGLLQLQSVEGRNALCRALRRILKRMLARPGLGDVQALGGELLALLDRVIASESLQNGPESREWAELELRGWTKARRADTPLQLAASTIARMSEAARYSPFAALSEIIRAPAVLAAGAIPSDGDPAAVAQATAAEQAEYELQMQDVAAAYRGEL